MFSFGCRCFVAAVAGAVIFVFAVVAGARIPFLLSLRGRAFFLSLQGHVLFFVVIAVSVTLSIAVVAGAEIFCLQLLVFLVWPLLFWWW